MSLTLKHYEDGVATYSVKHQGQDLHGSKTTLEFDLIITEGKHCEMSTGFNAQVSFDKCDAQSIPEVMDRMASWLMRASDELISLSDSVGVELPLRRGR